MLANQWSLAKQWTGKWSATVLVRDASHISAGIIVQTLDSTATGHCLPLPATACHCLPLFTALHRSPDKATRQADRQPVHQAAIQPHTAQSSPASATGHCLPLATARHCPLPCRGHQAGRQAAWPQGSQAAPSSLAATCSLAEAWQQPGSTSLEAACQHQAARQTSLASSLADLSAAGSQSAARSQADQPGSSLRYCSLVHCSTAPLLHCCTDVRVCRGCVCAGGECRGLCVHAWCACRAWAPCM
jgi:hypothetical protein